MPKKSGKKSNRLAQVADMEENYEPSDSEDEYTPDEKRILKSFENDDLEQDDNEMEVLEVDEEEDEDEDGDEDGEEYDEQSDLEKFEAASDIEGAEGSDDDIPDARAWGKKKSTYYNTDFVDQDYSTYNEKEEELAAQEEAEALAIQQRLAQQMVEADFTLDYFVDKSKDQTEETSSRLKIDFSDMSERQRMQLFKQESPEFEALTNDYTKYVEECDDILVPILEYFEKKTTSAGDLLQEYVQLKYDYIRMYLTNISYYVLLKSQNKNVKNHPVVLSLVKCKKCILLLEKENACGEKLARQLGEKLKSNQTFELIAASGPDAKTPLKKKPKRLGIMKQYENSPESEDDNQESADENPMIDDAAEAEAQDEEKDPEDDGDNEDLLNPDEKRAITYQISKNRGLTPHRRKELRNPRVKHRNKYRKAVIRRKGAVRTVRTETRRYDGEMSGIKATVRKSIKIK